MRELLKFDTFDILQHKVIQKGLRLNHLFLLDYLTQFFASGNASCLVEDQKTYYLITCKKIIDDLPILNIKKRRALMLLRELEQANMISIKQINNRSPKFYIAINF